jgi:hypothetical protein
MGNYDEGDLPYYKKELELMALSAAIREKENWEEKSNDENIVQKWREESKVTDDTFNYAIAELEYYKSIKDGPMEVFPNKKRDRYLYLFKESGVKGVWQADGLIPDDILRDFVDGVSKLENVPNSKKDWHPGSNKQVLDLVHPSLYCYVTGLTRHSTRMHKSPWQFIGSGEVCFTTFPFSSSIRFNLLHRQLEIRKRKEGRARTKK